MASKWNNRMFKEKLSSLEKAFSQYESSKSSHKVSPSPKINICSWVHEIPGAFWFWDPHPNDTNRTFCICLFYPNEKNTRESNSFKLQKASYLVNQVNVCEDFNGFLEVKVRSSSRYWFELWNSMSGCNRQMSDGQIFVFNFRIFYFPWWNPHHSSTYTSTTAAISAEKVISSIYLKWWGKMYIVQPLYKKINFLQCLHII